MFCFVCIIIELLLSLVHTHNKVTLKKSKLKSKKLTLTVIDSQSTDAESKIEVPVLNNGTLQLGGVQDQLCLGHQLCYFLIL